MPDYDVTISYKNNIIAGMNSSNTKTLQTEGTYCEDDIVVEYTKPIPNLQEKTVTPTESQQVFNGDVQGNKIVDKSFTSSNTKTISPSLTVGDTYFWEVLKYTNNGYNLSSDNFGSFTCTASEQLTDTDVYISASSIRLATNNYDFVQVYIYEATTVDGYLPVTVNAISSTYVGSGITRRSSSDLTASGATVTAPAGYYSNAVSKAVASGTAGTPTATKGTVSNHSISVTPRVTNPTGYITGGTKNGTAVTVSASELVSGTKSITENGTGIDVTNYAAVDVAVSGGGSSITVEPLSVSNNGTYTAPSGTAYSPVVVNVSGGGTTPASAKDVNFIDYDGTILYAYTAAEAQELTVLPANPSHDRLTAQGWNWTLAQIKSQLTAVPGQAVWVGQMYTTVSGASEIDIELDNQDYLSPYLMIAVNGTVSVNWGDNSSVSTVTGTSLSTVTYTLHEYAAIGNYTIKIFSESGSFSFYSTSATKAAILSVYGVDSNRNYNKAYAKTVKRIFIGDSTSIGAYAFRNCYLLQTITIPNGMTSIGSQVFYGCNSLQSVTIPSNVTSIGSQVFQSCYLLQSIAIPSSVTSIGMNVFYYCQSLQSVTIPNGVTSIGSQVFYCCYSLQSITIPNGVTNIQTNMFYNCYSLQNITIPSNVTTIGSQVFYYCYSLQSITIPNGVTNIQNNTFYACYSLQSITVPSNVTTIGASAFTNCYGVEEYHITPTTPPTLSNTNAFNGIVSGTIIYVPSESLEAYQTATNWSTYASYMQGE